jgi:nitrate reductase gamma subunit
VKGILKLMKVRVSLVLILLTLLLGSSSFSAQEGTMMPGTIEGEQRKCLDCHRERNINSNSGVFSSNAFCYECHALKTCQREVGGKAVLLQVTPTAFEKTRHEYVACIGCHVDVARSPHRSEGVQCTNCHEVHGEGQAHTPHLRVQCEACHMSSKFVKLDPVTFRIDLAHVNEAGVPISLTDHKMGEVETEETCRKCHHAGNRVGAPSAVLPDKSVFCIMCHNSPLSMGPWMFWVALMIGSAGLVGTFSFWFRGSVGGERESTHRKVAISSEAVWETLFSRRFFSVIKTLFFDVLLQRRVLKESVSRWSIHSLIYLAFLGRLILSLFTHFLHSVTPQSLLSVALLDKNYWVTAFVNDVLGLFIILGVVWAAGQRFVVKPKHVLSEEQDNVALLIIGVLILTGFALEGARILVTGIPFRTAVYAFVGYAVSRLWSLFGWNWQDIYGYLWYAHAFVWAVFIAYLPFGKLRHIIMTPLTLIIRDQTGGE